MERKLSANYFYFLLCVNENGITGKYQFYSRTIVDTPRLKLQEMTWWFAVRRNKLIVPFSYFLYFHFIIILGTFFLSIYLFESAFTHTRSLLPAVNFVLGIKYFKKDFIWHFPMFLKRIIEKAKLFPLILLPGMSLGWVIFVSLKYWFWKFNFFIDSFIISRLAE